MTQRAPSVSTLQKQLQKHRDKALSQREELRQLRSEVDQELEACEAQIQKLNDLLAVYDK